MKTNTNTLENIEFSVIVPLYNKERSICFTVESVLNQTYTNFELIIINDGSTDNSLKEAQSFNDSRIKILSTKNGGVSSARNLGIETSQNHFIIFLDADDIWLPFCLEEFCYLIKEFPEAEVYCTNFNMTGKNLKGSFRRYYIEDYYFTQAFYLAKWRINTMIIGCVAIRRNSLLKVGSFNLNITHGEDIDLWERLATNFQIAKSERVTTIYRTEAENRATFQEEKSKKFAIHDSVQKNLKLTTSQKLYYGILTVFALKSFVLTGRYPNIPYRRMNRSLWMLIGIFFIIKVQLLKSNLKSKCH